jgi:bifunctional non-homologous end joining protein LigD
MGTLIIETIKPQLSSEVESGQVKRFLNDDDWVMQEKMDGKRVMIHRIDAMDTSPMGFSRIVAENRSGKNVTEYLDISLVHYLLTECSGSWTADGELVGDVFWCFDFLGEDLSLCDKPLWFRHAAIPNEFRHIDAPLQIVPLLQEEEKKVAFSRILKSGGEGVVFKKKESPYCGGRSKDWQKCKFITSASVVVLNPHASRRSVEIGIWENGHSLSVGSVSIPGTTRMPCAGEIIEVQYLYATAKGKLFQPVYLMQRDDLSFADCGAKQLKFKQGIQPHG